MNSTGVTQYGSFLREFSYATFELNYWKAGSKPILLFTVDKKAPTSKDDQEIAILNDIELINNTIYNNFFYYINEEYYVDPNTPYLSTRASFTDVYILENYWVGSTMFMINGFTLDFMSVKMDGNTMMATTFLQSSMSYAPVHVQNVTADNNNFLKNTILFYKFFDTSAITDVLPALSTDLKTAIPYTYYMNEIWISNSNISEGSRLFYIRGAPNVILRNNNFTNLNVTDGSYLFYLEDCLSYLSNAQFDSSVLSDYNDYLEIMNNSNVTLGFKESFPMDSSYQLNYAKNDTYLTYRIYDSKFENVTIDESYFLYGSEVNMNQSLVSIDQNIMDNVALNFYADEFFYTSSVKIVNFAFNNFTGLSGVGALVES